MTNDVKILLESAPDSHLLTADQVSELLDRSIQQLADDRKVGRGPKWTQPFGPSSAVRYRVGDVRAFVNGGTAS